MSSSNPPPLHTDDVTGRPMGSVAAGLWALSATFTMHFFVGMWAASRGGAIPHEIGLTACQLAAYAMVFYFILRRHRGAQSIGHFFALRGTSAAYYPLAILLGASASIWMNAAYDVILRHYPFDGSSDTDTYVQSASLAWKIGCGVCLVILGPLVEEGLFRGAIFGSLRKSQPPLNTLVITSLLFAMVHIRWQIGVPIVVLALLMGSFRQWSGSLVPSFLTHAVFNGVSFAAMASPKLDETFERYGVLGFAHGAVVFGAFAVSGLCFLAGRFLSTSGSATRARELDA
jgi:membrane protease YdiL (CAAX protease family)